MDQQGKALRFGVWVILLALLLRLASTGFFRPLVSLLQNPNIQSFLIYIETGRKVRFSQSLEEFNRESPAPQVETAPLPTFSGENPNVYYACSLRPDVQALLESPLTWNLQGADPKVLILHTHATESYTKHGEPYTESAAFRTLDEQYNMLSIGGAVAEILSNHGISVIHDRELHDYPSYDGSYNHAREAICYYLEKYPTIELVLDLHRDASGDLNNQRRSVVEVDGQDCAQLMLVMGSDGSGLSHPNWEENLALGLKLQAVLEQQVPGITRPLTLRGQRFNQDLSSGAVLVEVGTAGNSHGEALLAAQMLAEAVALLAHGTE